MMHAPALRYPNSIDLFREIWLIDFEFTHGESEAATPDVHCLVAREYRTGEVLRVWREELQTMIEAPFAVGEDALTVAFFASAEITCFLELGWPLPVHVLDLFTEHRCATNGLLVRGQNSLLAVLKLHNIDGEEGDGKRKREMRDLAIRGAPFTDTERSDLIDYCQSDVDALWRLLPAMLPQIELPFALHRGRHMKSVGVMEFAGVPIDAVRFEDLKENWEWIQLEVTKDLAAEGIYVEGSFRQTGFATWLEAHGIHWPRLPGGALRLDKDTFKSMGLLHPEVEHIRQVRKLTSELRTLKLQVGPDARNRALLSPFASKTSRNQPSSTKFIFGLPKWLRCLIKPPEGHGIAYIDYAQQEIGIAAAYSQDSAMIDAYQSGDPYLEFGKQAGGIPDDGTKESHPDERELYKVCMLSVGYGAGADSIARRFGEDRILGQRLLRDHHATFMRFWEWSEDIERFALGNNPLRSIYGWELRLRKYERPSYRSIRNHPVQTGGSEMLRLAIMLGLDAGVRVVAPAHDAVLIEFRLEDEDQAIRTMRGCMADASRRVLYHRLELRTDVDVFRYPGRFVDKKGAEMWDRVMGILEGRPGKNLATGSTRIEPHGCENIGSPPC